ncbi:MarR family winged helix-turn-helix transcriptional regulator [Actinoplanes sp. NPDC000266]
MDPRFAELADLVIDLARELRIRGGTPLNQTQSQVMRFVHGHPGRKASEIADRTGLKRANVSAAITELRDLGFLTSRRDDKDGRAVRIDATPKAEATLHELRSSWSGLLASTWGPETTDLDPLIARLRSVLHALPAKAEDQR